jgi:hypothetical protein
MLAEFDQNGFALIPEAFSQSTIGSLIASLDNLSFGTATKQRAGRPFGIRNLLEAVPLVRKLAETGALPGAVRTVLGPNARLVNGIFFDKTSEANWKVAWHQDLTISVKERKDIPGYGAWTVKAGTPHVQPPHTILESMVAVRLHLDDADESNGALKVIPGSHRLGRLSSADISRLTRHFSPVLCAAASGSVLVMRPLLLHASSTGSNPTHRRVVHLEFANCALPEGLAWNN